MSNWGKQGGKKSGWGGGGGGGWAGGGGGKWGTGGGGGGWGGGGKSKGSGGKSPGGKGKGEDAWWGDGGWDAWEGDGGWGDAGADVGEKTTRILNRYQLPAGLLPREPAKAVSRHMSRKRQTSLHQADTGASKPSFLW